MVLEMGAPIGTLQKTCKPKLSQHPMIFLSSAAAFGFIGFISILRDRHTTAIVNFSWCLVLLFSYCFFPRFPQ